MPSYKGVSFGEKAMGIGQFDKAVKAIVKTMSGDQVADALAEAAKLIMIQAIQNAHAKGLYKRGNLIKSIGVKKVNQFRVDIVVEVVYGAVHEYGLEKQRITPRQRRFFWAMYASTGDEMWKALALSATYTIPARPYVRPAIESKKEAAAERFADLISKSMQEAVS